MSEYPRVWLDRLNDFWWWRDPSDDYPVNAPYPEHKVVPADAIVIERSALPPVDATGWLSAGDSALDPAEVAMGVEFVRSKARDYLALAEYLDAHPPGDEAQVEALTEDVRDLEESAPFASDLARALIARGWHKDADR